MNITAIIAEYNPFHNGHAYHIQQSKKETHATYCIVIMSGNFVQRGVPAIIDKYTRTKMALLNGADLVLELPTPYACSNAEVFAQGAINILTKLNCITHLAFGSEHGDISLFQKAANYNLNETLEYQKKLKNGLKNGLSFPKARHQAMLATYPELSINLTLNSLFQEPNNILGIEYCKALSLYNSPIIPTTIKRQGSHYHDEHLVPSFSSATAIRNQLSQANLLQLTTQMPSNALNLLKETWEKTCPVLMDDCSAQLHQMLLHYAYTNHDFISIADISPDFSDKIIKILPNYHSFSKFCEQLKSKDITSTRISRNLLHILLGLTTTQLESFTSPSFQPYAKVLGFNQSSAPLLKTIKNCSAIPLITKNANAQNLLKNTPALELFLFEIHATNLYHSIITNKYGVSPKHEYATSPIMI